MYIYTYGEELSSIGAPLAAEFPQVYMCIYIYVNIYVYMCVYIYIYNA